MTLCDLVKTGKHVTFDDVANFTSGPPPQWFDGTTNTTWNEEKQAFVVGDADAPLIVMKISASRDRPDALYVKSFFVGASPRSVKRQMDLASTRGRTLPGLAMEFIRAYAKWVGCARIDLGDGWVGYNGDDSSDLQDAAKAAKALLRRSAKLNPSLIGRKAPSSGLGKHDRHYLDTVEAEGYYGPWGFKHDDRRSTDTDDKTVLVEDMLDLRAPFADLCAS